MTQDSSQNNGRTVPSIDSGEDISTPAVNGTGAGKPAAAVSELRLFLSQDGMQATLRGRVDTSLLDRRALQTHITRLLKDRGVCFGLSAEALNQAIEVLMQGQEVTDLVIAQGSPPGTGRDARIEVLTKLAVDTIGRKNEHGHIDFRDRGPLPVVTPGTPIARLIKAVRGIPGKDVLGNTVQSETVRVLTFKKAEGITLENDDTLVVAAEQGSVSRPSEEKFEVKNVLEINGDVDYSTGHVQFPGMVRVTGAVLTDFKVVSYSLQVEHLEPGSIVEVESDLTVNGGIMGAFVKAGNNVSARFVRDAKLFCGGNLTVENEIVQSQVEAGGRILMTGSDARIANSHIRGVKGVTTGDILSFGHQSTQVNIGVKQDFAKKYAALKSQLQDADQEWSHLNSLVATQTRELGDTESEMRQMIDDCKKETCDPKMKESLMGQLKMLKPMRDALKEGLEETLGKLDEMESRVQRMREQVEEMERLLPGGQVWLDVRGKAEPATLIRTPKATTTLDKQERFFSAREAAKRDPNTGSTLHYIKFGPLRSSAK